MRLLVVEDEKSIGKHILKRFTERGFTCDWSMTGLEAIEACMVEEYDCVILDRRLPDVDGIDVCRHIRNQALNTPIIMLTALSDVEQKIAGLDAGADDYLTKPFSMEELAARVNALIRRTAYQNQPILKIRKVELNSVRRTVKVNDKIIPFSNREFLLLEYIMHNAGKPLTRTQIFEHVWESNSDAESNLVDVYINYVRKKIDIAPSAASNIETVRGYGYKYREET